MGPRYSQAGGAGGGECARAVVSGGVDRRHEITGQRLSHRNTLWPMMSLWPQVTNAQLRELQPPSGGLAVSQAVRTALWASLAYALLSFSLLPSALAGGVESTVAGARAVGRGGAMSASATGFDAMRYNPARLHLSEGWSLG